MNANTLIAQALAVSLGVSLNVALMIYPNFISNIPEMGMENKTDTILSLN